MNDTTHWLNRQRLTVYPRIVLAVLLLLSLAWLLLSKHGVDPQGKPLGYDFITFYAASKVALQGHASSAYNIALLYQAEKLIVPASNMVFVWYYPPPFYLLILPLARMPYLVAYAVFIPATLTGYVLAFRRVTTNRHAMWCLAAFFRCVSEPLPRPERLPHRCTRRRGPALPQIPAHNRRRLARPVRHQAASGRAVSRRAHRHRRVAHVDGSRAHGNRLHSHQHRRPWNGHAAGMHRQPALRETLPRRRLSPWGKMPTVFAFLRMLGTPVAWAYTAHAAVAAVAGGAVWYVWRRSTDWQLRSANLMTATFLVSPYLFDYDLAWLAFPIAWLALVGLRDGWLPGEREVLVLAWLLPLLMASIAIHLHLQIGPFVLGAMLWITLRRVQVEGHQPAVPAPARFVEAPAGLSHAS